MNEDDDVALCELCEAICAIVIEGKPDEKGELLECKTLMKGMSSGSISDDAFDKEMAARYGPDWNDRVTAALTPEDSE